MVSIVVVSIVVVSIVVVSIGKDPMHWSPLEAPEQETGSLTRSGASGARRRGAGRGRSRLSGPVGGVKMGPGRLVAHVRSMLDNRSYRAPLLIGTRINGVHLEQDLRDLGWRPVQQMVEPNTGVPFTRWFPPANPDRQLPDREFIADNMDFPPHSEKGLDPLGEDTC